MKKQWIAALLALWSLGTQAEDQLCAVILIEIAQEATFERQAFEATMRINNGLDSVALSQLKIQVSFEDDSGHVVKASSDPDATDASFFIRLDDSQNVDTLQSGADGALTNGVIAAKASGVLRWVIIPTAGAAGTSLSGKRYNVGASLSYKAGGNFDSLSVAPTPSWATIRRPGGMCIVIRFGLKGGVNRYAYVSGNPFSKNDLLDLAANVAIWQPIG